MKKFISILLAVMLVASVVVSASAYSIWPIDPELDPDGIITVDAKTAAEMIAAYEAEYGTTVETNRYFFQMPNGKLGMRGVEGNVAPSWFNNYTQGAGVYWWGSAPAACEAWAGYQSEVDKADENIYYADVPTQVVAFIWNNGIDGTMDADYPLYYLAAQTVDIASEYPDPGEYVSMPEGADSFDHCIFIINPDEISINPLSEKQTCGGTWYFYYDNGCYGEYATDSAKFVSVEANCCNPDHFDAEGNHVGYVPSEDPTSAPVTDEPTTAPVTDEPTTAPVTDAPTTAPVTEEPTTPAPQVLRGDYDQDNDVTVMDATRAQRIIAELDEKPDADFLKAVDADGDGELNITDATRIQRVLAELCDWDGNILNS